VYSCTGGPHLEVELTQQARLGVAFRYARVLLLIAAVPYMPTDPVTAMVSRSTALLSHCVFHRVPCLHSCLARLYKVDPPPTRLLLRALWSHEPRCCGTLNVASARRSLLRASSSRPHPTLQILYFLSSFLDAFDGAAARALNQSSSLGALLDMLTDRVGAVALRCLPTNASPRLHRTPSRVRLLAHGCPGVLMDGQAHAC
jgi:hypothetical protein